VEYASLGHPSRTYGIAVQCDVEVPTGPGSPLSRQEGELAGSKGYEVLGDLERSYMVGARTIECLEPGAHGPGCVLFVPRPEIADHPNAFSLLASTTKNHFPRRS
jgi:hypothetical protein